MFQGQKSLSLSKRWCQQGARIANDDSNGDNTHVIAIDGNFDDAQTNVKHMFNDVALREKLAANKMQFSSANSMNIGRLVPQVVYYVYAYAQLVKTGQIHSGRKSQLHRTDRKLWKYLSSFLCQTNRSSSWKIDLCVK